MSRNGFIRSCSFQSTCSGNKVRPEGLEPPTTWFEARYSVQLSYGRIKKLMDLAISFWGEWWDLNPRSSGPQPDVLTPTPHPPYLRFSSASPDISMI